jgi:hypothetical protein
MSAAPTPQLDLGVLADARAKVPSAIWMALTARQQAFVALKLANPNISDIDAAKAAGCPPRSAKQRGHEMAHDPHVVAAITALAQRAEEKATRDAAGVLKLLWDNAEDARKATEYAASNQALGLLAKTHGLLEKRIRISFDNPDAALAQLKAMPKAERVRVLRELMGVE